MDSDEKVNGWDTAVAFLATPNKVETKRNNGDIADATYQKGRKIYQYLLTLSASLLGMQSGMALGWTSPILPYFSSKESFLPALEEHQISWITSLLALGAIVGAGPAGKIADFLGRKVAMGLAALPFLVSWLTLIFAADVNVIYVGRFIGGIGAGASCVLVPVYIGEIAEASIRGTLGTLFPLLFSFGIVSSYTMGAYLSYVYFNVGCCAMLFLFFASMPFLPESPMWLVHCGRKIEAIEALTTLRGYNYDKMAEISVLQEEAQRAESRKGGVRDLIGTKPGRKAFFTCFGLMWFQQMSGIDAVLFYTVTIFQEAGSTIEPFLATIVIGLIEVVMTIIVALIIDKFGRKPLLLVSGTAMTLCLSVLGYYFKLKTNGQDVSNLGWLPLTSLSFFNIVFSIGYGVVPFAMISELFPPETKGVASSISIMVHWSLVFAVTKLFPTMQDEMGEASTFWTFGSFTALSVVFTFFFIPETRGKTLQDIQKKLEGKHKFVSGTQRI